MNEIKPVEGKPGMFSYDEVERDEKIAKEIKQLITGTITAKDLLTAAGYINLTAEDTDEYYYEFKLNDRASDNLTDMLIRELSEEQLVNYRNKLCELLDVGTLVCWVPVILATPEQKATALMETYKEME